MHRAAKCKNLEAATLLVQHGFAIEAVDEEGQTALHIAAETANHQMVEKLLELGAAVDARDNYQQTPLILASQGLSKLSVIALLKADADANALTRNGYSAIGFAVSTGGWQLKQKRTRDIVRLLLAAGADPEIGTVYGVPVMAEIRRYTREVMHRLYPGMEMDDRLISQQLAEAWDLEACLRYIEESSSRASS